MQLLRLLFVVWAALLLSQAQAAPAAEVPTQAKKPTFIAVGDGLTEGAFARKNDGWGLLMQERYVRKADVVNRGFGGYFTSWMVEYLLDELFNVTNPTFVMLFLGAKDTLTPAVSGSHYTSPQQFGRNVERIIRKAQSVGVKHFLIVTPPPVCEACKKSTPKPWDRENAHSKLYVDQLQALSVKYGAGFLNIFERWQADPAWADKLLLRDRLHLSSAGNKLLWKQMQETIAVQVPAMAWSNVPMHYPLMDVIDKDDPDAAFDKVQRSSAKKQIKNDTAADSSPTTTVSGSSGRPFVEQGRPAQEQQQQQQQQLPPGQPPQRSSVRGLATQGAGWLLLALAVAGWHLVQC